jgi:hypothetical protein
MVGETRRPLPAKPGQSERYDYEYKREGVANAFMFFRPLAGWRHVKVTARRTKRDFAACMKDLGDVHCQATVNWRFTTEKARQKLHWLYQSQ